MAGQLPSGTVTLVQVLLSQTAAALVADDVELDDLGEHQLKGLTRPERVFQIPGEFPALRLPDTATVSRRTTERVGDPGAICCNACSRKRATTA